MEDFHSNLSELHNVPFSMDNGESASDTTQSTRDIPVSQPGAYNVSHKNYTFSALPLYQHYHTAHSAVFPQVNSTKYNEQYQFSYRPMAVDMTNRNIPVNANVRNPNGVVETVDLLQTKFTESRLQARESNNFCKHSRNKFSRDPQGTSSGESVQYIKRDDQRNLTDTEDVAQMNDISLSKVVESVNRKSIKCEEKCEEKTDVDAYHFLFTCGGCQQSFYTICKLHAHLKTHNENGSYYYSEFTRTAYPKFDSCCTGSQTEDPSTFTNQKYSENTGTFDQKLDSCSTGTQTEIHKTNQKHSKQRAKTVHRSHNKKDEEDLVSLKVEEDKSVMEGIEFIKEMEADVDNVEIKEEVNNSEFVADINSTVNPDSDTDEYNPEESIAKCLPKRPKNKSKNSDRKKCKIRGSRKLKQLKMTIRLKQEEKKDKRMPFLSKDRKPKARAKRKQADDKIICKLCDTEFPKKLYLRHHIKAKHSGVPHLCQLCSDCFPTNKELIEHRKAVHNRGYHQCELCDKVLSTKAMLEGHYLVHKGIKPFSCSICEPKKEFTRKCQLKAHMDTHSTEKTLQCEFCGKPFNARYLMMSHVKHCGGIKPYKCDFCEMSFVSNHCLQRHRRTHTGEKPFICEVCAFASSNASCLARHMRIHTGEKPFICQYCKQTFAARGALKKHVRIHTQEKPYKCRFCAKAFTQNWNLKTHERQHTGETPYKCHVCGVGYKQNVLLKTHLRTHFAPNTDNDSQHIALNSSASQCQSENQSVLQNQSLVSLQTVSKSENLKCEFPEQQHSQPQLVELHTQPLVSNLLLTSFLHPGYNMS